MYQTLAPALGYDPEVSERLPVVGVMGSGAEAYADRAAEVGEWLAHEGVHLLTGGGGGVMTAVARAFCSVAERRGLVVGILPSSGEGPLPRAPAGYPNPWVEIAVRTHLPLRTERGAESLSRNHINVLSSDVVIALPGGAGTSSEVALALRYGRPLVAYLNRREEIPGLPPEARVADNLGEVRRFVRDVLTRGDSPLE